MKKFIVMAIMAIGSVYTPSFAQDNVPSKKQDKEQRKADKKERNLNDTKYKQDKKQDKLDKKDRKMHKKQRKVNNLFFGSCLAFEVWHTCAWPVGDG